MLLLLGLVLDMLIVCVESKSPVVVWAQTPQSCDLPPSLWCSSLRIAEKCKVTEQCKEMVWSASSYKLKADDRVHLALYYESLCPDCKVFITNQLWPTYNKISSIIDLDLVPYGNAQERQDGDTWVFTCQHGPQECLGNLIETCAIEVCGGVNVSFPFIACMEMSHESINKSATQCAKQHGVDLSTVLDCVVSPVGNRLEHEMGVKTDKLDPPHSSVPWVTLNGEHTDDIEERAESDLLGLVCDTYKGPDVPKACKTRHKRLTGCLNV